MQAAQEEAEMARLPNAPANERIPASEEALPDVPRVSKSISCTDKEAPLHQSGVLGSFPSSCLAFLHCILAKRADLLHCRK